MEIRLLVNGNLVHVAILPELQMITSKRDIFFVTTAPEFMAKDLNIKGLHINETPEKRLVTTPSECSSNEELARDTSDLQSIGSTKDIPLNLEHEMNNLLEIPNAIGAEGPSIQRARSLQKTSNLEEKPLIAKSNSCGDSYHSDNKFSALRGNNTIDPQQTGVPPNSPRNNATSNNNQTKANNQQPHPQQQHSPMSPTKRNSKYRNLFSNGSQGTDNYSSSPDRLKPLRIYRIPLAKLAGAHSHFHMQSFNATAAKTQHYLREQYALNMKSKQKSIDVQLPLPSANEIPE